jgi:hypothetical protein
MRRPTVLAGVLATAFTAACSHQATLQSSADALGAAGVKSIEYSGSGRWYQFGQAASPKTAWPQFDVKSYTATINYETPAARVQMARIQSITPGRVRPTPTEQRPDQYVSGTAAWNRGASSQLAAQHSRGSHVHSQQPSPNAPWRSGRRRRDSSRQRSPTNATATPTDDGGADVTFTGRGPATYKGRLNQNDEVVRVQTVIDDPVLGDAPLEFRYSILQGLRRHQVPDGHRTRAGRPSGARDSRDGREGQCRRPTSLCRSRSAMRRWRRSKPPSSGSPTASSTSRAGTHHSVAIDQGDHIVVVEAPQNEARSLAVIETVKKTIPKKPIPLPDQHPPSLRSFGRLAHVR